MVPMEHTEKGTKIKLKPKRLRIVPGMIRKSFRRAAKSPNVDVVNETDEMDLTEIKTSDNELLSPETIVPARRRSSNLSIESAPIPGSKSTTPSVISCHSFQPVFIDFGDNKKPDLYAVKQASESSESPPSPNIVFPPPPLSTPPPPPIPVPLQEESQAVSQQSSTPPKDPSPPKLRGSTESTPTQKNSKSDIFEKQSSL
uniref:Uncharacterized protein n=1 Tax=Panagrolaimus sp. ES5 TaxID=591445 RepID=A0AC34FEY9_9BILA